MTRYFSTFIPGLDEFIASQLRQDLAEVQISEVIDGLIVYQIKAGHQRIQNLRYLNNSFVLLKREAIPDFTFFNTKVSDMASNISDTLKVGESFRVMFYRENQPVSIDHQLLSHIEEKLAKRYRLVVDRTNPDTEFWFSYRREGVVYFGQRLTKHPDYKKILAPGQLRPELASIMCLLSNPDKDDIVLDPCAGNGAIAVERTNYAFRQIIASDISSEAVAKLETIPRVQGMVLDATAMAQIQTGSITKIITDPPWGIFQSVVYDFYEKLLAEFAKVLVKDGLAVILLSRHIELPKRNDLKVFKRYDILVSGKKATIHVLKKI